jgi:hypothetical protein
LMVYGEVQLAHWRMRGELNEGSGFAGATAKVMSWLLAHVVSIPNRYWLLPACFLHLHTNHHSSWGRCSYPPAPTATPVLSPKPKPPLALAWQARTSTPGQRPTRRTGRQSESRISRPDTQMAPSSSQRMTCTLCASMGSSARGPTATTRVTDPEPVAFFRPHFRGWAAPR